jgi:hypothetical protein
MEVKFFVITRRGSNISVTEVKVDLSGTSAAFDLESAINSLTQGGAVYIETIKVS